jgi:hypothetical protein
MAYGLDRRRISQEETRLDRTESFPTFYRQLGDFNKWNKDVAPMKKDEKGIWNKVVMLMPGTHEYKFLVDGE